MVLTFYNTLTKKIEEFKPITDGRVGMYNCGPTVYNYAHIGNLRSYIFADTLRRTFEYAGYEVTQVINVTDIGHLVTEGDDGEDKMTSALKREGKPLTLEAMREVANFYFERFKDDIAMLNIKMPAYFPFASDHIKEDIEMVSTLMEKRYGYATSDGVYFNTKQFPKYGQLSGLTDSDDEHSRIGVNSEKKNSRDFAIWKFNNELGYEAPFGKGFPGWHIECSAMSMKYLGETFDVHTGGIDHIPVHHNNEIAQSEATTGKEYVHYWLHHAHISVDNGKMSKSIGNVYYLNNLIEKGFSPEAFRLWVLMGHYKTTLNFTWEALESAQSAYDRLVGHMRTFSHLDGTVSEKYRMLLEEAVGNDLDTPRVVALVWEVLKDEAVMDEDKKATLLEFDKVLGLRLTEIRPLEVPNEVIELVQKREEARSNKDWSLSDSIRREIHKKGFEVMDTPTGPRIEEFK